MKKTKVCTKCKRRKKLDLFSVNNKLRDGRSSWCKACHYQSTRRWAEANREKVNKYARDFERKRCDSIRLEIMNLLGGPTCVRCGFDDFRALQIDHVKNGGNAHRRSIGNFGFKYWVALLELCQTARGRKQFQVLCANCNWIKRYESSTG